MGVTLLRTGGEGRALVRTRMNSADQEDDASDYAKDADHQHPGRTAGTGREDRTELETMQPGEITAAAAQHRANQKLQNPHQHHATPKQAASRARPVITTPRGPALRQP